MSFNKKKKNIDSVKLIIVRPISVAYISQNLIEFDMLHININFKNYIGHSFLI